MAGGSDERVDFWASFASFPGTYQGGVGAPKVMPILGSVRCAPGTYRGGAGAPTIDVVVGLCSLLSQELTGEWRVDLMTFFLSFRVPFASFPGTHRGGVGAPKIMPILGSVRHTPGIYRGWASVPTITRVVGLCSLLSQELTGVWRVDLMTFFLGFRVPFASFPGTHRGGVGAPKVMPILGSIHCAASFPWCARTHVFCMMVRVVM